MIYLYDIWTYICTYIWIYLNRYNSYYCFKYEPFYNNLPFDLFAIFFDLKKNIFIAKHNFLIIFVVKNNTISLELTVKAPLRIIPVSTSLETIIYKPWMAIWKGNNPT